MSDEARLVLGTTNRGKREEMSWLLAPLGITVLNLSDFPQAIEVVEDGQTFADNARFKAVAQARQLGEWVLAEDSGLAVDALGGSPGALSARFSGPDATDLANNRLLLERLAEIPPERRRAHYVCHATIADPAGAVRAEVEDYCHGRIALSPRGSGGFGYDPLFEIVEFGRTFGELGPAVKECLSHRGRAMRRLTPIVERLLRTAASAYFQASS